MEAAARNVLARGPVCQSCRTLPATAVDQATGLGGIPASDGGTSLTLLMRSGHLLATVGPRGYPKRSAPG
jgi:hypothetical protein